MLKKCSTGLRFIFSKMICYKIHTLITFAIIINGQLKQPSKIKYTGQFSGFNPTKNCQRTRFFIKLHDCALTDCMYIGVVQLLALSDSHTRTRRQNFKTLGMAEAIST
jgi:hypothetical protein